MPTHTLISLHCCLKEPVRKVMGVGKFPPKKIMQGRVTEKENVQRRSEEKKQSCRVNSTVGLTNYTRLKGTLAATLYFILQFSCSWWNPNSPGFLYN